jgi:hypothetical protein
MIAFTAEVNKTFRVPRSRVARFERLDLWTLVLKCRFLLSRWTDAGLVIALIRRKAWFVRRNDASAKGGGFSLHS